MVVSGGKEGVGVDLKEVVEELELREVRGGMVVGFGDIVEKGIEKMWNWFREGCEEYGYEGEKLII